MSDWLDHWWPYLVAGLGLLLAGWRSLRKVLRVADAILGFTDIDGHRIPGVAERVEVLEQEIGQLRADVAELKRLVSVQHPPDTP